MDRKTLAATGTRVHILLSKLALREDRRIQRGADGDGRGGACVTLALSTPPLTHMTEHGTRRVAGPEGPHLGGTYEQSAQVRPGLRVDRRPRRVASSPSASSASSSRRPPFGPHDLPLNPNQPL